MQRGPTMTDAMSQRVIAYPLDLAALPHGEDVVVTVRGEVDVVTAPQLRSFLFDAVAGARHLVLDLSDLEFIDAAGLSVLVATQRRLARRGSKVVLRSPPAITRRVLQVTGLERLFSLS